MVFSDWDEKTWVAAAAAFISLSTLMLQLHWRREARRTKVTVQVVDSVEPRVGSHFLDCVLTVHVTNSGELAEYVEAIGARAMDDAKVLDGGKDYDSEDLQPNETLTHRVVVTGAIDELQDRELVGFVRLGNRKEIVSRPMHLRADVVEEYKAHNTLRW